MEAVAGIGPSLQKGQLLQADASIQQDLHESFSQ
jgi:hypothetical protein